jgi:RND family efflux transporter MFP subunit
MKRAKLVIPIAVAMSLGLALWVWIDRRGAEAENRIATAEDELPTAAVTRVARRDLSVAFTIAGEFKPFQDVDVHAKVAGYIRRIYVDVGDRLAEGQVIADLEVPELAAQLAASEAAVRAAEGQIRRAEGDLQRAKSGHDAVHSAFKRLKAASDSRAGLVAEQEVDDAQAKDRGSEGQLAAAEAELSVAKQQLEVADANQKQYRAMSGYTRIRAPFAGVVTNRYADTGALIAAGTSSSAQAIALVRLAETAKLRLVLPVAESIAAQVHLGDRVSVHVPSLNEDFAGKVARFADALDIQTRTMQTEIDVENRQSRLMPGMYAETHLELQPSNQVLTVPLEAVTRNGEEITVLTVNAQDVIEERSVKLGVDDGSKVEVLSGLSENEEVIVGGRGKFRPGQKVRPQQIAVRAVAREARGNVQFFD